MGTNRKPGKMELLRTGPTWVPFLLRVVLAIVVFPHGAQKLFGIFGGFGFQGTMEYFTFTVGMPYSLGLIVILLETMGVLFLLLGLTTRIMALGLTILGAGIMFTTHLEHGFFMNWYGNQSGEGIEYFLLWMAISSSLVKMGGGNYSIDHWLYKRWLRKCDNYWMVPGKI